LSENYELVTCKNRTVQLARWTMPTGKVNITYLHAHTTVDRHAWLARGVDYRSARSANSSSAQNTDGPDMPGLLIMSLIALVLTENVAVYSTFKHW